MEWHEAEQAPRVKVGRETRGKKDSKSEADQKGSEMEKKNWFNAMSYRKGESGKC